MMHRNTHNTPALSLAPRVVQPGVVSASPSLLVVGITVEENILGLGLLILLLVLLISLLIVG